MRVRVFILALAIAAAATVGSTDPTEVLACRIKVSPESATRADTIAFRYEFSGTGTNRIPDRFMRDEETFGHSLTLKDSDATVWRFIRTSLWSYRLDLSPDSGVTPPRSYRFRFPASSLEDHVRFVKASHWRDPRSLVDSAAYESYRTIWNGAARAIPPGSYQVSAVISGDAFPANQHGDASVRRPVSCESAELRVLP